MSSVSLGEFKAENWLKYFSVPASGTNNPARLSCHAGLGCLLSLSKNVRTNLPLRAVCFDSCPSLSLPRESRTCPSACLAICTFPSCRGAEGPGLLQGAWHRQHSKYLLLSSLTCSSRSGFLVPLVSPLTGPFFLSFPDFGVPAPSTSSNLGFLFGNLEFGC